ncbi:MAG: hypothetical protein ACJAYG_001380 [Oceanicoccus sp.]|jgi:hypothetical protein
MKQISIICGTANPVTEVTELLSEHNIDIRDLSFQRLGHDSIINLVVDKDDESLALLTSKGYAVVTDETLLLKVENKPGVLAKISRGISDLGVDIRSLTLVDINGGGDVMAISTSDNDKVRKLYGSQLMN